MNHTTVIGFVLTVSLGAASTAAADCRVPRSGWALRPAEHGEIGELYWAAQNYSERWISIKPYIIRPKDQGPAIPEILLIFSVCFPGKNMETPVTTVQIRAQINRNFIPAFVPDPKLEISVNNQPFSELTKLFPRWTAYPHNCLPADSCAYEAVIVEVPLSLLKEIATARVVTGDVSGTRFEITPPQVEQLARFVLLVGG
jgi:hypothetical protein